MADHLDSNPRALAYLEIAGRYWRWVVTDCPFINCLCSRHIHGGGDLATDPRRMLGHRAHVDTKGYVLIDGSPEHTGELISSLRTGQLSKRLY